MLKKVIIFCSILALSGNIYAQSTHKHRHHKSATVSLETVFPMQKEATGSRVFMFSPKVHAWAIYNENGERVKTGRASGGRNYCPDIRRGCRTIVGTFSVLSKGGASCKSKIYPIRTHGGAPMPYCMRFSPLGYAIHGSYSVPNHNASHGCIRVPPADAKWLSQNFMQTGTKVVVLPY